MCPRKRNTTFTEERQPEDDASSSWGIEPRLGAQGSAEISHPAVPVLGSGSYPLVYRSAGPGVKPDSHPEMGPPADRSADRREIR